ncbi:MAG: succinate dehydrogenase, cytochrome b556 subunit [Pseudomonadota bacterium]
MAADGNATSRPLSPHISIYRWQINSVLSILHRGTGIVLAIGTLLLVYWLVSAAAGPDAYRSAQGFIGSFIGQILLIGWAWSLFYHLCNGIRHLVWDAGYGFEISTMMRSSVMVLGAATGLTILVFIIGWIVW